MTQNNGNRSDHATLIIEDQIPPQVSAPTVQTDLEAKPELATRTKLRARQKIQQNRFVIVAAGAVVFALLIFAVVSAPRMSVPRSGSAQKASRNAANGNRDAESQAMTSLGDKSLLPITDSGRPVPKESHDGYLNEQDLERSATKRTPTKLLRSPRSLKTLPAHWAPFRRLASSPGRRRPISRAWRRTS